LNQSGLPAVEGTFNRLALIQVNRSQAGEYMCVLTSEVTGETTSSSVLVTVQCKFSMCNISFHIA
jgi:hypothetical protein